MTVPPANVRSKLETSQEIRSLHLHCLHYSNEAPFQFEDRWINLKSIPEAEQEKFEDINPNEWLVKNVPWTNAEHILSAANADAKKRNCFHWQQAMRFLLFNAEPGAKKIW